MTHLHITTWLIAVILFFVAYFRYRSGSERGAKIVHMIARLFYILIILSGGMLMTNFSYYAGKMILGLIVIVLMEMTLVRTKKGKGVGIFMFLFIVTLLGVIYMGLSMPQGFHFFS